MTSLILEQSAIDQLKSVEGGVEVRDHCGNLIGFFQPAINPKDIDLYECPIRNEELLRRESKGGGRPLAEIWDGLRKPS